MSLRRFTLAALTSALMVGSLPASAATELLNVSYDPTRELYVEYNQAFNRYWQSKGHEAVKVQQSHGGSGKQARSVIDGLRADVVTLALASDIDALYQNGKLIPENWQSRLPNASTPYTSTIVFLVRKGNPKGIKDWDDLVKPGVEVITPNPKTSGGARWNFLGAWAYAQKKFANDEAKTRAFVTQLYKQVPVLDTGARGSTITFVNNKIGDVLLAWENEAFLALKEEGGDNLQIVVPSLSILAEPPVTVVDKNVDRKGTRELAEAYLNYLYSEEGQRIAAKNFYRPRNAKVAAEFAKQFPTLELVTIDGAFGGWKSAQPKFFGDGGIFDQIYRAK
ncbi:sulfate transport system substrate-binding protein [Azomonas agilis]|uniref:Sulfate transport system substrate-binding protein n=1 Tax=Azomonas agilis TaxID=116849 RepID=A0A562J2Q6_9GAMM|nr:sulfate ABC transporter substrate-binding protein [Azomonas agilis]TWH77478.1 sulfate transport system substrate-binding protein [Azomonas agilis]